MKRDAARQISRIGNLVRRKMSEFSTLDGLTFTQTRVLYFILRNGEEICQKDIEEEYMLRPSTATALLKSMEEVGMILREQDPDDSRKKRIRPTQEALSLKKEAEREITLLEECLTKDLTAEELEVFFSVTDRMISSLSNEDIRK